MNVTKKLYLEGNLLSEKTKNELLIEAKEIRDAELNIGLDLERSKKYRIIETLILNSKNTFENNVSWLKIKKEDEYREMIKFVAGELKMQRIAIDDMFFDYYKSVSNSIFSRRVLCRAIVNRFEDTKKLCKFIEKNYHKLRFEQGILFIGEIIRQYYLNNKIMKGDLFQVKCFRNMLVKNNLIQILRRKSDLSEVIMPLNTNLGFSIEELSLYNLIDIEKGKIDLSNHIITSLDGIYILNKINGLVELNLKNNYIQYILSAIFELPKLKILNLSHNSIRKIVENVFVNLPELEELYLDHNFIREFSIKGDNQKLQLLYLNNNNIEHLGIEALLKNHGFLYKFKISKNNLDKKTKEELNNSPFAWKR